MIQARRFFVSGRVQGVYFRASTREAATALGLRGYARNLDDGRVEVMAVGESDALGQLESWLWRGPALARVDEVHSAAASVNEAVGDFNIA